MSVLVHADLTGDLDPDHVHLIGDTPTIHGDTPETADHRDDVRPTSLDNAVRTGHARAAATVLGGDRVRLVVNPQAVAVVRLPAGEPFPDWAAGPPLVSITATADETSVVCATTCVPDDVRGPVEGPLVAVTVDEVVEFSLVGILVALLKPLADAGIPVLTVSTFDTDWVLLPAAKAAAAAAVWRAAGHEVEDLWTHPPAAEDDDEDDDADGGPDTDGPLVLPADARSRS